MPFCSVFKEAQSRASFTCLRGRTLNQSMRLVVAVLAIPFAAASLTEDAAAITNLKAKRKPFYKDISTFSSDMRLPIQRKTERIRMSEDQINQRLESSKLDKTIEPLSIVLGPTDDQLIAIAERIAIPGKVDDLIAYLKKVRKTAKPVKKGSQSKTIYITPSGFQFVDSAAFADYYSREHHKLDILTATMKRDPKLRRQFFGQIRPFFDKKHRKSLYKKIMANKPIRVDRDLLPDFASKMVRKYIVFRGPNCFHAALAFHSPKYTASSLINVKVEKNYHRAMINYDELWRAIQKNFYEVNHEKHKLKYGDMLVFFDVPKTPNMSKSGSKAKKGLKKAPNKEYAWPIDYKWIRHTATYLIDGHTFSKGSKSPNTPYAVRTLEEEWSSWQRYTKNLGVKVFRRARKSVTKIPPRDLADWMY